MVMDRVILVPDVCSKAELYAATELQRFLTDATGEHLDIVHECLGQALSGFVVGRCLRARRVMATPAFTKLGEDGILLVSDGKDVYLLGSNQRAQIYAVYEFLERFLGVRFLAWDCVVTPRVSKLTFPPMEIAYTPQFMYRETLYFNSFPKDIALRHRLNGPMCDCDATVGGRWAFQPYVHSFAQLVPPDTYFEAHPEYFSLIHGKRVGNACDAQLCLTNPDVLRIATAQVLRWIETMPDVPIFDVSQNDGDGACECDACMALVQEEGSQHGPILRFVNAIADAVAARHPDKWIETLAYHYSTRPPALTRPRPNVIIRLCHVGNYFRGFAEDDRGSGFAEYLDAWSKVTSRIFIWHYATNFGHYLAPNQNLLGLAKDIKTYAAKGVNGVMVQANYQSPGGELAELRQYLAARLLWDPSQDPAVLRREFCEGYYGDAAQTVLEFLALMDGEVERSEGRPALIGYANWDPADTVRPEFVAQALDLLTKARHDICDPIVLGRIDKLLLPFYYMQLRYPSRYGLDVSKAHPLIDEARRIVDGHGITQVRELILHSHLHGEAAEEDRKAGYPRHDTIHPWLDQMKAKFSAPEPPVVFDLYAQMDTAACRNCLVWRADPVWVGENRVPAIYHHPPMEGVGEATFRIALPSLEAGKGLRMRFATGFTAPTADGVEFSVQVDGQTIWSARQATVAPIERIVNLAPYAGRTVELTLTVDCLENISLDWAHWIQPRLELA